jgi:hypothetical protein
MVPQNDLHAEKLVVNEPAVDTHAPHEVEDGSEIQEVCHSQQHEAMAHVAEHHAEENGDRREHEDGGNDLVVFGDRVEFSEDVDFEETGQPRHDRSRPLLVLNRDQSHRQLGEVFVVGHMNGEMVVFGG